jgi:hypothetical protein
MRFAQFLLLAALSLASCTHTSGRDFAIPLETQLAPGRTTTADVRTMFGEPDTSQSFISSGGAATLKPPESEFDSATGTVPGVYETLRYRFVKAIAPTGGGDIMVKSAVFLSRDGVLIGYNSVSNFPDHPTNFDEGKISLLRKGESTRNDAEAILGPPTGQAIYPLALKAGEFKLQYNYGTMDPNTHKTLDKELTLLFGADSRLLGYRAKTSVANMPAAPAPAIMPLPIFIPHK